MPIVDVRMPALDWTPPPGTDLSAISLSRELGSIDSENPDVALMQLPFKIAYFSRLLAELRFNERELKQRRDNIRAALYLAAKRGALETLGIKATEQTIEAYIDQHSDYVEAVEKHNDVVCKSQIIDSLLSGLASKEKVLSLLYGELKRQNS
jgi:hypothetical protein